MTIFKAMKSHELDHFTQRLLESYGTVEDMVFDYFPDALTLRDKNAFAFVHDGCPYVVWKSKNRFWFGVRPNIYIDPDALYEISKLQDYIDERSASNSALVFDAVLYGDTLKESVFAMITYAYADNDQVAFHDALEKMAITAGGVDEFD